jgi:hypothetical protein
MIIDRCTVDGCTVLTIGSRCVEHDLPVTRTFVRGRPFAIAASTQTPLARSTRTQMVSTTLVRSRRTAGTLAGP